MKRVMLIVWKWRDFELANRIVNAELLKKEGFEKAVDDAEAYDDVLFDSFRVGELRPDGSVPDVIPRASVVRTYIEKPVNNLTESTFQYLKSLIRHLKREDNELFVFLHRRDGFGHGAVKAVLGDGAADKCFLIGDGRDNIYFREIRNQGLLGDDGYFFRRDSEAGKPSIRIADNRKKIVYLRHFDKVWAYYKNEFHTKIFELKEDLLSHFYTIYPNQEVWNKDMAQKHMQQDRKLHLRVNSFIDDKCSCMNESEKEELDKFGKDEGKSYEFDDLRENLASQKNNVDEYVEISQLLYQLFHKENISTGTKTIQDMLYEIERSFNNLLDTLHTPS